MIRIPWFEKLHLFEGVSPDFKPWEINISPSALYNCSLACRKRMKIKTPEVKWVSIKRWMTITPNGIRLPDGVYLSIKRREVFSAFPNPHFEKKEFILMMFPYGNVWSMKALDEPITEDWLWSDDEETGTLILESMMRKDAARPIQGYFKSCHKYLIENPDQVGIHQKRRKNRF